MRTRAGVKIRVARCDAAYVQPMVCDLLRVHPMIPGAPFLRRMYRCTVNASYVMTANDSEYVNPGRGMDTGYWRIDDGPEPIRKLLR